jgi:hypothetical protein
MTDKLLHSISVFVRVAIKSFTGSDGINQLCSNKDEILQVCVCTLALVIWHANVTFSVPHYIITCDLPGCTTFFHIISKRARLSGKKLLNTKCAFWFYLQRLSEIFIILRRIQRDITINICRFYVKWPLYICHILIALESSRYVLEKSSSTTLHENLSSGGRVVPCGQTERQTDRQIWWSK